MAHNQAMKLNKFIISAFILLIGTTFFSCGNRPSNVLPEDKMVNLLVDMEIAEAYTNTQSYATSEERIDLGKQVLEAHGVSEETLDTTLAWYGRNMDDYSKLFDKVDKELLKRKKKYTEVPEAMLAHSDNLWPYGEHLLISDLSAQEALTFSFPISEMEKGKILGFSMYLPNQTNIKSTFGVEYKDGTGEAGVHSVSTKNNIKVTLQTDTAKEVALIFGSMILREANNFPVYIDSISITTEPFDSLNYLNHRRGQKSYGLIRYHKEEKKEVKDTVDSDSKNHETLEMKEDSIRSSVNIPAHPRGKFQKTNRN